MLCIVLHAEDTVHTFTYHIHVQVQALLHIQHAIRTSHVHVLLCVQNTVHIWLTCVVVSHDRHCTFQSPLAGLTLLYPQGIYEAPWRVSCTHRRAAQSSLHFQDSLGIIGVVASVTL